MMISPRIPRLKPGPGVALPSRAVSCRAHSFEWEHCATVAFSSTRRIQLSEVLEHQAALLGRQLLQLFPRGIPQPGAGPGCARLQDIGNVDTVARGRAADALLGLIGLIVRQRATGIEQPMVQALLALDGLLIKPSGFELAGQLLGLLRERAGGGARPVRLEALELLGEGALSRGKAAEPLHDRLATH